MKVNVGDVIEIKTSKGLVYALYTHRHPQYGALLRVLAVRQGVRFATFFPLQAAVDRGIVTVAGNTTVPDDLTVFPLFRAGAVDPRSKKVGTWWLWDGEREWQVGDLTPDQKRLPIRSVVNDALLVRRIEEGWVPEKDPR
ncbi:MAG: hypothetical protein NT031_12015 [Planctomycetota bacterium]|nr:hypothetical protein [Planctomycetota bacterium]